MGTSLDMCSLGAWGCHSYILVGKPGGQSPWPDKCCLGCLISGRKFMFSKEAPLVRKCYMFERAQKKKKVSFVWKFHNKSLRLTKCVPESSYGSH